jgi:hypothetical protein
VADAGAADRGMSPVVGKAMEATVVVLYVGLVAATLYGGAVAEYRGAAGAEVAERTLADAAADIEAAVPPTATVASVRLAVDLPATIAGSAYRVRAEADSGDRVLVLEHPDPAVSTTTPLVLPARVVRVTGEWESGDTAEIRVESTDGGLEVRLA